MQQSIVISSFKNQNWVLFSTWIISLFVPIILSIIGFIYFPIYVGLLGIPILLGLIIFGIAFDYIIYFSISIGTIIVYIGYFFHALNDLVVFWSLIAVGGSFIVFSGCIRLLVKCLINSYHYSLFEENDSQTSNINQNKV